MDRDSIKKGTRGLRRRALDGAGEFSTLIGHDVRMSGTLEGGDNCILNGTMEGGCTLDGVLVIGEGGLWKGDLEAATVVVCGRVQGDITARDKVELAATARVAGSITTPALAMAEGAVHQGEIKMTAASEVLRFAEKRSPVVPPDTGEGGA